MIDRSHDVREATSEEGASLRRLQGLLAEPSPELLSYGLRAGTVLVTTAPTPRETTSASTTRTASASRSTSTSPSASPSTPPIGYLLATHGEDTHVAELVVDPEYRREGRASSLLSTLLARRPAGERVTLAVARENDAARSLYRTFGFEQFDTTEAFFEERTAILLEREAPPRKCW